MHSRTITQLCMSSALPEGLQITGIAMVNLREQPGLQVCLLKLVTLYYIWAIHLFQWCCLCFLMKLLKFKLRVVTWINLMISEQELSDLMKSNSGSSWGNKFGMLLLPIYYHKRSGTDPLAYLKIAKVMIDRKKRSLEAHFSYKIGYFVMTYLGAKVSRECSFETKTIKKEIKVHFPIWILKTASFCCTAGCCLAELQDCLQY